MFFFAHCLHCLFQKSDVLAIKLASHAVPVITIDVLGSVDNVALNLTLAALKSRRVCFRAYETHLSAIQANTQTSAWFSRPHENERGSCNPGTPPSARPQTFASEGRRKTLRAPYAGVTFFFPADLIVVCPSYSEGISFLAGHASLTWLLYATKAQCDEIKRSCHRIA
jgi:hypothetical protein